MRQNNVVGGSEILINTTTRLCLLFWNLIILYKWNKPLSFTITHHHHDSITNCKQIKRTHFQEISTLHLCIRTVVMSSHQLSLLFFDTDFSEALTVLRQKPDATTSYFYDGTTFK